MEHNKIREAIKIFFKNDCYLIDNDLHEQALSHMLGVYLGQAFPNYNVDCEWNKNLKRPKTINLQDLVQLIKEYVKNIKQEKLFSEYETYQADSIKILDSILDSSSNDFVEDSNKDFYLLVRFDEELKRVTGSGINMIKSVRPDIIVHHRGTNDNLVVLEVKKKQNSKRYQLLKLFDLTKLAALTLQLGYKSAYYIEFNNFSWSEINICQSKFVKKHYLSSNAKCNVFEVTFK